MADWWTSFYDETFATHYAEVDDGQGDAAAAFLVEVLGLRAGMRLFDQCAGPGRIALPLARRGLRVVGVDASPGYAARAADRARAEGLDAAFHTGDAFLFRPDQPVDAAINWATSFGYTADDARNVEMLRRACEALRPGGGFALDYYNTARVLRTFQPTMTVPRPGGVTLVREAELDVARGLLHQRWIWRLADGTTQVREGATRLYLAPDLVRLLGEAGFGPPRLFGDVDGSPFGLDSARCIAVARRAR